MRTLRFYKDPTGTWYIDLPDWAGARAELAMVAGADTLLDIISHNGDQATVEVDLGPFDGASALVLDHAGGGEGGGHYRVEKIGTRSLNLDVWLCDVTNFVFGFIPETIYIRPH